jgi:hypothetical protein
MDRTVTFKKEETSGHEPQPGLDTKTDRLTDSRNVTLTSTYKDNPQLSDSNENLVVSSKWVLYFKTDWQTDRRS